METKAKLRFCSFVLVGAWLSGCGGGDFDSAFATTEEELTASQAEPFAPSANWTSGTAAGSRATFLADVTGGGTADLVLQNTTNIQVRRSGGASPFNSATTWSTTAFAGS